MWWVIGTIVVMAILAVGFALFIAGADRQRVRHTQRWWSRNSDREPGEGPPVG